MTKSILLVVAVLFSVCRANVMLGGCGTDVYCPGQTVSLTCEPDNENIAIALYHDDNPVGQPLEFDNNTSIGEVGNITAVGITVWYNKTDEMSVRVWFSATTLLNGFTIQCRDGDNETDYDDCSIGVNTNPVPNPTSIGVERRDYCDAVNITWSFASDADTSCVRELVRKVNEQVEEDIPKNSTYFTVDDPSANSFDICVSIASKSYENVTNDFTGPQCVKFNVPLQPMGLMESYNVDDANGDNEVMVTVTWMIPDLSRPGLSAYFIASNITDNDDNDDNDDDSSGASGESPEAMDKGFKFMDIPSNQYRMELQGAVVGNYYTVKLIAENCYGNSTESNITFQVVKDEPTDVTPTTPTDEDTPEPSASPTMDDDDEFPTWAIAVIVVVGVLFLVGILLAICIPIICCCCFGTILCCAAAEGGSKDIEMGRKGTHL